MSSPHVVVADAACILIPLGGARIERARSSKYFVPMGCTRHAHTDARPVCWDTTVAFVVRPPMPMLFNGQAPPRASFDGRMGNVGEKPDIGCLGSNAHTGIYMRGVLVTVVYCHDFRVLAS